MEMLSDTEKGSLRSSWRSTPSRSPQTARPSWVSAPPVLASLLGKIL